MANDLQAAALPESESRASATPARMTLVGRDDELAQLDAVLQKRDPAVIIVSAAAGMGKTTLLRAAALRAIEQGWATTHSHADAEIEVSQTTTAQDFSSEVQARLDLPSTEPVLESLPEPELLHAMTSPPASRTASRFVHPLVRQLRQRAPVLLLIDGYRPSPRFGDWFRDIFLGHIRKTETPIAVIISDRPRDVEGLTPAADLVVALKPPNADAVRRHFEAIGERLAPPMQTAELNEYIQAARRKPEILDTLTRLLRLVQENE